MTKILFVCHGNICRSPMAEFIMKHIVKQNGKENEFLIDSCAVSREELGNPIYPPAKSELFRRGIPINAHNAVLMSRDDYNRYDLIVAMDDSNLRNIYRITGGDPENKIKKLLDYTADGGNVADPWYYGNFEKTFE